MFKKFILKLLPWPMCTLELLVSSQTCGDFTAVFLLLISILTPCGLREIICYMISILLRCIMAKNVVCLVLCELEKHVHSPVVG